MPHLDAAALDQDPDGLAFLADTLSSDVGCMPPCRMIRPSLEQRFQPATISISSSDDAFPLLSQDRGLVLA